MHIYFHKQVRWLVFLVMSLTLVSCAKTTSTPIASGSNAAHAVQVFYSSPTDREYLELGLVTTQTGQTIFHDRSTAGMIEKLKTEALKMGADAIIVRSTTEGKWGLKGGGHTGFDRGNAEAVAIKFK